MFDVCGGFGRMQPFVCSGLWIVCFCLFVLGSDVCSRFLFEFVDSCFRLFGF